MFSRSLRPLCSLNLALRRFFSSSYLLIVSVSYSDGSQHDRCRSGPWSERDSSSWCPSRSHSETASGSLILVADDQSFLCICVPCHRGITWCVLLFLHTLDRARSEILFFFLPRLCRLREVSQRRKSTRRRTSLRNSRHHKHRKFVSSSTPAI